MEAVRVAGTTTDVVDEGAALPQTSAPQPVLHLRLQHHTATDRRVGFHDGVVDNEHMNRKKSKCCCIYRKPLAFGESSSEEEDECEHCFGHPEVKPKNRNKKHAHGDGPPNNAQTPPEPIPDPDPEPEQPEDDGAK